MRPRRKPISPKFQVGPPEPQIGPRNLEPWIGHKIFWTPIFHSWPLAITRGHQLRPRKGSPQFKGRPFPQSQTLHWRNQECEIYGIIYHYAPFSLRNPMVMASGPHYIIENQVPKSITPFQRKVSVSQSDNPWWPSEDILGTPITWSFRCWLFHSNSIAPREYWTRTFQGKFQEVVNYSN
ncbi:hypothetical protein O181_082372 [Austropuccinia psidii MF-1]|uniref:Uncharacterized protein n=1 Tax=Austropuccinia psidii MF-1 TaxID=1389203 RepID=A0A9Q3FSE7_9BASI|nr:hypothetical protein [Austropuccinia psidii MF-1]